MSRSSQTPAASPARDPLPLAASVVVMGRSAVPGEVKTRLQARLSPTRAAAVHAALMRCVLHRLPAWLDADRFILALDDLGRPEAAGEIPTPWTRMHQGTGDLGERLDDVWQTIGAGPVVFFGVDSPDVPGAALTELSHKVAADETDAAAGPVDDGGYWCLYGRRHQPALLEDIDWGSSQVYDQTRRAAASAGLNLAPLPPWHDVDDPDDLDQLRHRIADSSEPALQQLADDLVKILERD